MRPLLRLVSFFRKNSIRLLLLDSWVFLLAISQNPTLSQKTLPFIELSKSNVHALAWSPDGTMLAIATGNDVWLYTDTFEEVAQLQGHTKAVQSLSWNADGSRLASGGDDATIRIWDTTIGGSFGDTIASLNSNSLGIFRIAWSPVFNDSRLATSAIDEVSTDASDGLISYTVSVWDYTTNATISILQPNYYDVWSLAWSPDGQAIATSGSTVGQQAYDIRVWDTLTGQLIRKFAFSGDLEIRDIVWTATGNSIVAASVVGILVNDTTNGTLITELKAGETPNRIAWGNNEILASGDEGGHIVIWYTPTAQQLVSLDGGTSPIIALKWNSTGTKLASAGSGDGTVRIWDTSDLPDSSGTR